MSPDVTTWQESKAKFIAAGGKRSEWELTPRAKRNAAVLQKKKAKQNKESPGPGGDRAANAADGQFKRVAKMKWAALQARCIKDILYNSDITKCTRRKKHTLAMVASILVGCEIRCDEDNNGDMIYSIVD